MGLALKQDWGWEQGAGMAAGRKAGSFGKADDSCRSFRWLVREGRGLGLERWLSGASCSSWSSMKTNLKQKLQHRWSESNSDIQIVCWGQTTVGSVAVSWWQLTKPTPMTTQYQIHVSDSTKKFLTCQLVRNPEKGHYSRGWSSLNEQFSKKNKVYSLKIIIYCMFKLWVKQATSNSFRHQSDRVEPHMSLRKYGLKNSQRYVISIQGIYNWLCFNTDITDNI